MLGFSIQFNCLLDNVMSLKDLIGVTEDCSDFFQCQMPSIGEEKPSTDCKDISWDNET
jgi:hypothetical protein